MKASQSNSKFTMYSNPRGKIRLSTWFQPGPFDIIFARGKQAFQHEGNRRFRRLVKQHQDAYAASTTKYQKSQIVNHIASSVRSASPEGGFVKLINGVWYEVGDRACKEKIGQTFRDGLDQLYSSSTKAKARARVQRRREEDHTSSSSHCAAPIPLQAQSSFGSSPKTCASSVVSSGSVDAGPSLMTDMTITIPNQGENSLLDTVLQRASSAPLRVHSSAESLDLEPLPLESSMACCIEFNDAELSSSDLHDSFDDDMGEFCEVMKALL